MLAALAAIVLCGGRSDAFPYVVKRGDTMASIAERMYGRVELERVLVAANGLEGSRGGGLVVGMRIEVPAVRHHGVGPGESWKSIAAMHLGTSERGGVLARLNGEEPWIPPAVGREIVIPFNLRYVASRGDTTSSVAYRFLGNREQAWVVAVYNDIKRASLRHGEALLLPLVDLTLSDEGRREAEMAGAYMRSEARGDARRSQDAAEPEIAELTRQIHRGLYLEAIATGAAILAREGLTEAQLARTHEHLTEAYAAMGARGLAADACARWRQHDHDAVIDPVRHSPKIVSACLQAGDATSNDGLSP